VIRFDPIGEAGRAASVMALHDFEGEHVAAVNGETEFCVVRHYANKLFMGWNVYARDGQDLKLLETCEYRALGRNIVNSIRKGLAFGATYYRLPAND